MIHTRSHLQLAHISETPIDLYVGNFDACNQVFTLPENCIKLHVYHADQPGQCWESQKAEIKNYTLALNDDNDSNFSIEYLEHSLLGEELITKIVELTKKQRPIFVHCAAGLGRSPTIAVLILTAVGMKPWDAMAVVSEAMWKQYTIPHCPSFDCKVLNEIFNFYDGLKNEATESFKFIV